MSNGGKDLIEDASVIMAYGRRYGLIGRNGTGACGMTICAWDMWEHMLTLHTKTGSLLMKLSFTCRSSCG